MTDQRSTEPITSDAAAWASLAFLACAILLSEMRSPLALEPRSATTLALACGSLGIAAWFYRAVRPRPEFAVMCVALVQVLLFSALGIVLSYLLARGGGPLWDAELARWDRELGFDWLGVVHWVDRSPLLAGTLHLAYGSLIPQIVMLVLALGFTGRVARLRAVMLAAILCGAACILVSTFLPAVSYPASLGLTGRDFHHVDPWGGYVHLADLRALRDGSFTEMRFGAMQGIITFPSYHAGLSAVTMWGFWAGRMAWLRWPGILLAGLTIAATPVDGGHYLVDVLAGVAIAAVSIAVASRAVRWVPAMPPFTASPYRRSRVASGR